MLASLACGLFSIPRIIDFCIAHKLYDEPNERKVHRNKIPRLGGICFLPGMLLSSLIGIVVYNAQNEGQMIEINVWAIVFGFSLVIIYIVGTVDDMVGLGAKVKFVVQMLAASLLPAFGLYLNSLYGFLGFVEIPFWIGALLTLFVIVFINNAINLIDGIDGLSSGLSVIALIGFLCIFLNHGMLVYCVLASGLIGVLLAFAYFNVFGKVENNRKIFMGDSGSLTIGFISGALFVKCVMVRPDLRMFSFAEVVLAYSLLIVPVYDVVRLIIVRSWHRQPLFGADKNHVHHKLLRAGLTQHQALLLLLFLSLVFIGLNMVMVCCLTDDINIIVLVDIVLWLIFHYGVDHAIRRRGQEVYVFMKS